MIELELIKEKMLAEIRAGISTNKFLSRNARKFDVMVDFENQNVVFWFKGSIVFTDESEDTCEEINIREAGGQFPDFNMKFEPGDISKLEDLF